MDALLEQVEVPLPEAIVQAQYDSAIHGALHGLDHDEAKLAEVLAAQGKSREEFEAETRSAAEKDVKRQLLLDVLADELEIQVGQDDLTERLVATSRQYGIEPQQLFGYLQENNQLPAMFADVRRGLTDGRGGPGGDGYRHRRKHHRHQRVLRPARHAEAERDDRRREPITSDESSEVDEAPTGRLPD